MMSLHACVLCSHKHPLRAISRFAFLFSLSVESVLHFCLIIFILIEAAKLIFEMRFHRTEPRYRNALLGSNADPSVERRAADASSHRNDQGEEHQRVDYNNSRVFKDTPAYDPL